MLQLHMLFKPQSTAISNKLKTKITIIIRNFYIMYVTELQTAVMAINLRTKVTIA